MKKLRIILFAAVISLLLSPLALQAKQSKINFPDVLDYQTLKCDFHMHTVFSDGQVWPTVRVDEAVREGLDVIAISDHIEYQPHKKDIPTNHNRVFEIARSSADKKGVLLIKAAEITRSTPPGHFNVLFLDNIEPLDTNSLLDAMKAAKAQDGFIFWNHPGWKPKAKGWFDIHTELYKNKWLHGIEVANGDSYYPDGHKWCIQKKLTLIGASDIHAPSLRTKTTPQDHRTMTLVFAEEKTRESIKKALVRGRTAVWYKDQLIGREDFLDAIFRASVKVEDVQRKGAHELHLAIKNTCDLDIRLRRIGSMGPERVLLPAMGKAILKVKAPKQSDHVAMFFTAENMLVAPQKGLKVTMTAQLKDFKKTE